jgi:PAT family beta-lactamase induction signal transducer AmpG
MLLTGAVSGHLQEMMGYVHYFVFVMLATIPSFIVVWLAPFHNKEARPEPEPAAERGEAAMPADAASAMKG